MSSIDLVKIGLEGYELKVLKGFHELSQRLNLSNSNSVLPT